MEGPWINVFDRKELNKHMQCYSVKFKKSIHIEDIDETYDTGKSPQPKSTVGQPKVLEFHEFSG